MFTSFFNAKAQRTQRKEIFVLHQGITYCFVIIIFLTGYTGYAGYFLFKQKNQKKYPAYPVYPVKKNCKLTIKFPVLFRVKVRKG